MKKHLAILAAAAGSVSALSAQTSVQDDLSVSTTFAFESAYVFRGVQRAEETFMPAIDISSKGAYFGAWGALPTGNYGDELDLYGGYGFEVSELVSLDVGGTYYSYPTSEDFDNDNTFEIYGGASFDVMFNPAVYVFYDFDLENLTVEGSAGYSYPLSDAASLDATGYVGWVSLDEEGWNTAGTENFDDYFYYGVNLALSYALAENASVSVYGNFAGSTEEQVFEYGDKNTIWYGLAVTTGF
ncbi:MAG: hypothetical protein E1N59_863 [Puniceicoccaceae bacterium 5H]|nr:MAG: hypothetical protein E1N59_863 [Puniceicoccaceae bacterium 5H]